MKLSHKPSNELIVKKVVVWQWGSYNTIGPVANNILEINMKVEAADPAGWQPKETLNTVWMQNIPQHYNDNSK